MLRAYFKKRSEFNRIVNEIKSIQIQGARNIAKAALYSYSLFPDDKHKKILINSRPTEPMLHRVLYEANKYPYEGILAHFDLAQEKINKNVLKVIKNGDIIFTHCHSTNVVRALIYAKKQRSKFEVFNTETRPLFQGRKTAVELSSAGISVTTFVDSALGLALSKKTEKNKNKVTKVFLGADAILKEGVINKIGSGLIAETAFNHKIPVYIVADSWKFSNHDVPIETRPLNEIWDKAPKNVKIKNPAFEFVPKKYIKAVVSELGVLEYNQFLRKVEKK